MNPQPDIYNDLENRLARKIQERGGGRIRKFGIERRNNQVTVRGQAESYYAWQLAIAACRDLLAEHGNLTLECKFDVDARPDVE